MVVASYHNMRSHGQSYKEKQCPPPTAQTEITRSCDYAMKAYWSTEEKLLLFYVEVIWLAAVTYRRRPSYCPGDRQRATETRLSRFSSVSIISPLPHILLRTMWGLDKGSQFTEI